MGFLDHDEVYGDFDNPLADVPAPPPEVAASVCGFGAGFDGDVREHLTEHFDALPEFHRNRRTPRPVHRARDQPHTV
ncbi:hypothetical protein [Streptomyces sp. NPDC050538]|uniref:hypothetical protein n=1 Tax=Streptomyces sp. NPDC050538 TaxID=3365627 RepID=UPI0037B763EF